MRPFTYQSAQPTTASAVQALSAASRAPRAADASRGPVPRRRHHAARSDEARRDAAEARGRHQSALAGLLVGRSAPTGLAARRAGPHVRRCAPCRDIQRNYPVIADALKLAASPQLRNMATLGGNVLQRTRCSYFRDVSYGNCNKRNPGSGCAALDGFNRTHAVLGTSEQCIATYPGDFAQALIALDATIEITGRSAHPQSALRRAAPATRQDRRRSRRRWRRRTDLGLSRPGPLARARVYLKIRDRQSYEFALASAAVALDMQDGGPVRDARIALGGVATVPWRAREAEALLKGQKLDDAARARGGGGFRRRRAP